MNNYDFSTINDKEFEQLCLDILNAKFNYQLQGFKVGKDKGVDLRFSTSENNNSLVVQVKHYVNSKFSNLKHTLKEKELKKLKDLNPEKYIVVTSLPLSPQEKDELKVILHPFVLSSNDIIGREDLNMYLRENPEIEKNHFKLWFSSINILNTVLNNAIEARTKYHLEDVKSKIPFYVITKKLDEANKILQKEKLLLITGQPGIGKTTLADIILFKRAKDNYKIYKVESIREAEDVFAIEDEEKQLFYFDDFLGANYYEIVNANKTESQLSSFVERVRNAPNKYLILTTRTVILNHAIEKYEKISRSKMANQQYEIKLADYTKYEKALILYNHLFFKEIKEELFNSILNDQFYKSIIQHKNYTPRIIEFITDKSKIDLLTPDQYHQFILNNLNNPKEIWRYSFTNQIEYIDRCLLLTLFTFHSDISESYLITAFENRLDYEKKNHNQIINSNQFNESIKILLNGFISSAIIKSQGNNREYSFINPSLTDFLIGHVYESFQERKSIISSITFIEQLHRFNPEKQLIPLEKELQIIIRDKIASDKLQIIESESKYFTDKKRFAIILETLIRYCKDVSIDSLLLENFKKIQFSDSIWSILDKLEYVLLNIDDTPLTFNYIKDNFIEIIESLMEAITETENAKNIPLLFEKYDYNYDDYTESDNGFNKLIGVIESVLKANEDNLKSDKKDEIKNIDEVTELYDEVYSVERELKNELFPRTVFDYDFDIKMDKSYWDEKIEDNIVKAAKNDSESEGYQDVYKEMVFERESEDKAIDDLFYKHD